MTITTGGFHTVEMLTREAPFTLARATSDGDGLTLAGYAAVFNSVTRIDSWEGRFDEQISPGAFAKTIRERTPIMQFDHGQHPLMGSIPIGAITTLREDPRGLYVEARLHDNWLTQPVRDAIASGSVDGMSFRFSVPDGKDTWDKSGDVPLRTIRELRCAELGPVVFPAYVDTTVAVRSLVDHLDPPELADVLRAFADVLTVEPDPDPEPEPLALVPDAEPTDDELIIARASAALALLEVGPGGLELPTEMVDAAEALTFLLTHNIRHDPDTLEQAAPGTCDPEPSSEDQPLPEGTDSPHSRELAYLQLLTLRSVS